MCLDVTPVHHPTKPPSLRQSSCQTSNYIERAATEDECRTHARSADMYVVLTCGYGARKERHRMAARVIDASCTNWRLEALREARGPLWADFADQIEADWDTQTSSKFSMQATTSPITYFAAFSSIVRVCTSFSIPFHSCRAHSPSLSLHSICALRPNFAVFPFSNACVVKYSVHEYECKRFMG